jgi:hypothetical protein
MVYYLLFFELQIQRYELSNFGHNLDSNFYFEIYFKSGADTWLYLIGPYWFVWISIVKRQILRRSDGSDRPVPLHLSEVFRSFGS